MRSKFTFASSTERFNLPFFIFAGDAAADNRYRSRRRCSSPC